MSDKCTIDNLAKTIMEGLQEYADLASEDVKAAVRKAGKNVKADIAANAPKRTGAYSKSWTVKTQKETANSLEVVAHSKTAISWLIFSNMAMPNEVEEELQANHILHRLKKKRSRNWNKKSPES